MAYDNWTAVEDEDERERLREATDPDGRRLFAEMVDDLDGADDCGCAVGGDDLALKHVAIRIVRAAQSLNITIVSLLLSTFSLLSQAGCENKPPPPPPPPPLYKVVDDAPKPSPGKSNINGTVLWNGDGKGLENVEVQLCETVHSFPFFQCEGRTYKTKTSSDGVYRFPDVVPGSYSFAIKLPGSKSTFLI